MDLEAEILFDFKKFLWSDVELVTFGLAEFKPENYEDRKSVV